MEKNFIKEFWDKSASKPGHNASWGDKFAVQLEIDNIAKYIKADNNVLDVGCANGYSTFAQLGKNHFIKIQGIDFSEKMIAEANKIDKNNLNINFNVGNVKDLPFADGLFDVTYTTRCLINLPTWEEQIQGLKECIRVTRKGGTIILSEAFYEPLQKLNALRLIAKLEPLVEHDFNRYIKKQKLHSLLQSLPSVDSFNIIDFSSIYYLGSRFLREIVGDEGSDSVTSIDYPSYTENPINKLFYEMENHFSGGDFGIQQIFVIKKE